MIFMALALATAAPTPILSSGFNAADMEAAARNSTNQAVLDQAKESVLHAEILRAKFVIDGNKTWETLSFDEAFILAQALGPKSAENDIALAWFFRTSSTQATRYDGSNVTGFYNPIADVWLLVKWAKIGGALRIADAILTPTTGFDAANGAIDWTQNTANYGSALRQTYFSKREVFGALTQEYSSDTIFEKLEADRDLLRNQSFEKLSQWVSALGALVNDESTKENIRNIRNTLIEAKGRNTDSFGGLPLSVRSTLEPAAIISRKDGKSIILISPLYPLSIVSADFEGSDLNGAPKFNQIDLRPSQNRGVR